VRGAGPAGELGPDVLKDDEAGRDVLELLADLLTDRLTLVATVGAGAVFGSDVMDNALAGQARWQRLAAVATAVVVRVSRCGRLSCGRHRLGLSQDVVRKEQQLIGINLLAPLAVAVSKELLKLMLEPGDEVALLAQGVRLLADLAMGGVEVVGEYRVARRHALNYGDACCCVGAIRRDSLGGSQSESQPFPRGLQVNAAEHCSELDGGPFDVIRSQRGPAEGAAFEPFHPDHPPIAVPI
jgi:hypothetical protein